MTGNTAPLLLLVKATLLLGFAFALVRWERTAPAIRRHGVWTATFVALVALPLLTLSLPGLGIPVPSWRTATVGQPVNITAPVQSTIPVTTPDQPIDVRQPSTAFKDMGVPDVDRSPQVAQTLLWIWLAGVAAAVFALTRSLLRVRKLIRASRVMQSESWTRAAHRIAAQLEVDVVPRLMLSDAVATPMAGNIGQPIVFLPPDAAEWDADRRDVVLTHELTHLARRDPLWILAARIAGALYWFHPLMWLAARRSTADCEQACDESVLALGIRPSTYARVLLDFEHNAPASPLSVALPIVHRHRLEKRVMAILSNPNTTPPRAMSPRRNILTTIGVGALIVTVAAARPVRIEADSDQPVVIPAALVEGKAPTSVPVKTSTTPSATMPTKGLRQREQPVAASQGTSCWNRFSLGEDFSGSMSMSSGNRVIQRIGRVGRERVAQMTFDDLRVCMVTEGFDGRDRDELPGEWIGNSDRVIIETERNNDVRRLEINGGRNSWFINGRQASFDDNTQAWRRAVLDLLDRSWEVSSLRGQESTLRGEISTIHGERSTLLGEISTLRGHVSTLQGEISTIRGQESTMLGEISTIRGHESTLRGQISTERGAISTLESQRWERGADRDAIASRIRRHEDAIRQIEADINRYDADGRVREVRRRLEAFDTDSKVAEVERRIREFDVDRKVREIERQIDGLDVDGKVRGIEGEIRDLDVDRRAREINARRDDALDRLRSVLGIR